MERTIHRRPGVLPGVILCALPLVCSADPSGSETGSTPTVRPIPPSVQRSGDPGRGYRYLVEGDYLRSGVPLALFERSRPREDELARSGPSARLPYYLTATRSANGVEVVVPNCLQCHAARLDGRLLVGLGNATWDYTVNLATVARVTDHEVSKRFGRRSPEREAYRPLRDAMRAVGPRIRTQVVGLNPADRLAFVLAAHRDRRTLEWRETPQFDLPEDSPVVATDVPALWLLRKKHAMFYTGAGRGDFARVMMAASLLTLADADEARELEAGFVDLLAWLLTLRPPAWPGPLDRDLAARGRDLFGARCAGCHGTYGEDESYPNLLIGLETVGTDPRLAEEQFTLYAAAIEAFNESWFGEGPHAARLEPGRGYVAPPLDGVWATAPYLHNGSVPTLADLLDSTRRPDYWKRRKGRRAWDPERVGVGYKRKKWGAGKHVYDTTLPGCDNGGHTFADDLSPDERRALLEYLKGL